MRVADILLLLLFFFVVLFLNWNGNVKKNVIEHADSSRNWTGNKEVLLQGFFVCFGNFNFVSVPQL